MERLELGDMSMQELKLRLAILNKSIKDAQAEGDMRWRNLVPQVRSINQELSVKVMAERAANGIPEPKPVHVKLPTACAGARAPKRS